MYYSSTGLSVKEELRLQDIWTGGRTDRQGDSYIPPKSCLMGVKRCYVNQFVITLRSLSTACVNARTSCEHLIGSRRLF